MTWDATAISVTTKAIGQVESSMQYDSVNLSDPITVGFFQWYGTRAAAILDRMRDENSASWSGIAASLVSDLTAHSATDSFWDTRYLNQAEINSVKPVLLNNVSIQDDQANTDINSYKNVAVGQGMSADSNTESVSFFCVMYNQDPRGALRVLSHAGPDSSLDRIYAYCLNDSVLGQYKTRYSTAYNIINTQDSSGVGVGVSGGTGSPTPGNPGSTRPVTDIQYVKTVGNQMSVRFKDSHALMLVPSGHDIWIPCADSTLGASVPPPPVGTPATDVQTSMKTWLADHNGAFAYSQGAGRLDPVTNGYTDCSGLMYYVYKTIAGVYIGTWTGDQSQNGALITTDSSAAEAGTNMQVGDLIFYRWSSGSPSTFDHVAMYIGGNQIESHGGPDSGPVIKANDAEIGYAISGGGSIMVRRYV